MLSPPRTPTTGRRQTRSATSALAKRDLPISPTISPRSARYSKRTLFFETQEARKKPKLERKPRTTFFTLPTEIRQQILFLSFEGVSYYIHTSARCVFHNDGGWGPGLIGWGCMWAWSRTLKYDVDERLVQDANYVVDKITERKATAWVSKLPFRTAEE
ncbi:hypothetical protein FKW77_010153 [Venturia effusa]|uniref:Uncharacterized protein n=1 Tax=Venturia effusa TaxID=50376 RepID=A0A517L8D0_9PEZI|nr:hypothetical protein FKW77_010153 [Venturia effusa]